MTLSREKMTTSAEPPADPTPTRAPTRPKQGWGEGGGRERTQTNRATTARGLRASYSPGAVGWKAAGPVGPHRRGGVGWGGGTWGDLGLSVLRPREGAPAPAASRARLVLGTGAIGHSLACQDNSPREICMEAILSHCFCNESCRHDCSAAPFAPPESYRWHGPGNSLGVGPAKQPSPERCGLTSLLRSAPQTPP